METSRSGSFGPESFSAVVEPASGDGDGPGPFKRTLYGALLKGLDTWVFNIWFLDRSEIVDFGGLGGPGGRETASKRWGA